MSRPTLALNAAFTTGAADITAYLQDAFSISRGTQNPVQTGMVGDAGTFQCTLNNTARRFDPNYGAGPYYTALAPGVPVNLIATWAATPHTLFQGSVDGWPLTYPDLGVAPTVALSGTDLTSLFANATFAGNAPAEPTGYRILRILAAVGYGGATSIQPGTSIIGPLSNTGTVSAWSHAQDVCAVEWGQLYFAGDGTLTFRDRNSMVSETRSSVSQATFGDTSTNLRYSDITMRAAPIVNDVTISWNDQGATVHHYSASVSSQWGLRSLSLQLPFGSADAASNYAYWLLYLYAYPQTAYNSTVPGSISFEPTRTPTSSPGANDLWPQALGREIGDLITVVTPTVAGAVSYNMWISGIQHSYQNRDWTTTFWLTDARFAAAISRYDVNLYDDGSVYGL